MSKRRHISDGQRERIFAMTGGACFYCGYAANCLDHIMPHSYVANDTDDNLVPACNICNSIAGNQHFANLQAKKEYILAERDTPHWQRKLARMVVTVIQPITTTVPPVEPGPEPEPVARVVRISNRPKPKPLSRVKSAAQPKSVNKSVPPVPSPALANYEYIEDRPDYIAILVADLIEHIDDLTDDDADEIMAALIGRGIAANRQEKGGPTVYGRNGYGQIEGIAL